jgi:hypothetical protein
MPLLLEQRITRVSFCGHLGVARTAEGDPARDRRQDHSRRGRPIAESGREHALDNAGDRHDPVVGINDEVAQSLTVAPELQYHGRH